VQDYRPSQERSGNSGILPRGKLIVINFKHVYSIERITYMAKIHSLFDKKKGKLNNQKEK